MTASKYLISTAAAAAVVGAIGIAYAQTATPPATPSIDSTTTQPAQSSQPMPTTPSTTTAPSTTPPSTPTTTTPAPRSTPASTAPMAEPEVRADRN